MLSRGVGVVLAVVGFFSIVPIPAAELPQLKPLSPLRLDLGTTATVIVAPQTPGYQINAQLLRNELALATKQFPRVVDDSVTVENLGPGPILVLGNLMDSRLARRLYFEANDFTDYSWPSQGGHVVRTIRDPFGTGAHVVMLGGSDARGVLHAVEALITLVKEQGSVLGYVNQVKLGRWSRPITQYTSDLLADTDSVWRRIGHSGSWEYQIQIARAAIGYLRTGNEAYLRLFRREIRRWFDRDVHHPSSEAPQMLHGFLNTILIPWDLVRDHPCFSDAERLQIDQDFFWAFCSKEGPRRISSESRRQEIRNNHGTRTGLDAYFGGRYFLRRHGREEARAWLDIAEGYFRVFRESAKPNEDSWGHQWAASMDNTAVYFLASGQHDYFRSPGFRRAADRALIAHPNGKPPLGYMMLCAAATEDTGYLSGWLDAETVARAAVEMRGHSDEHLRSFSTGRAIVPRQDLLGVAFAPLDRLWYETVDGGATTTFLRTVPVEAGFDKIALREGWAAKDYYLLLDGISGGGHSYQDGNCIVRYAEQGVNWASNTYHDHASATVRQQNGVFVAVNGAGPGQLHRGARRLYAEASGDYLAAASVLEGIGEADWQRHVLRKRGTWTLVVDRVLVKRPGEVLAERHWHLGGQITPTADGLVSRSMGRCLHLQTAGILPEGMRGTSDRIEVLRAQAEPDQPLELATLLSVNTNPKRADVRLVETVNGWRVETAGRVEFAIPSRLGDGMTVLVPSRAVHLGKTEQGKMLTYEQALSGRATGLPMRSGKTLPVRPQFPTVSLPWRTLHAGPGAVTALARAADGRVAAGDRSGTVVIFAPDGTRRTSARFPSPIQALHFLGTDLLVGEDRGALTRLSADGSQCWQLLIPYVSLPWAYWSEGRSRIREISSADIQGKGQPTIFVANSDRRLYALTAEGKELWKTPVEWGVFTAMSVARQGKGYTLLGGTSQPSIFGRCILFRTDGKLLTHYSRADLHSWSNPSQFRDLRLADLDGDGRLEAVCGVDTDCRQLVVFQSDGKIRWEADVAGAANAVAVRASEAAGGPIVYCASNSGYVYGFDSRTGRRRFATFVGEPTHFVAPVAGGRVIAVGRSGMVFVLGDEGQVAGRVALDRSITGLLRPGEDRSTNAVLLGTVEGNIMELVNP